MAGEHLQMLRALFRPWYVKAGSALATLFAFVGVYAGVQDQFPDRLPKLQDEVIAAHYLILPWWGWLLVLQAILMVGLYEYVRRTLPPGTTIGDMPRQELLGAMPQPSIGSVANGLREDIAQVNNRLVAMIAASEKKWNDWVQELCKRIDQASSYTAKQNKSAMEAIAEVQNLMEKEARARGDQRTQIYDDLHKWDARIASQIQNLSEQGHGFDIDLIYLLNFAVDSVSVRHLNRIIRESPLEGAKNVAAYDNPGERERRRQLFESYIRNVLGWLGRSLRGQSAAQVVKNAEEEMERHLLNTPPSQRPKNVDPLILRQYTISELKCRHLVTFLEMQRDEIAGRLTGYRDALLERQQLREAEKKARMT